MIFLDTVDVVVPTFALDEWRERALRFNTEMYFEEFGCYWEEPRPRWTHNKITPTRANIAAARNLANTLSYSGEVIVFNDADSLCNPDQIREAVRLAEEAPGLVFAFTNYCRLSKKTTESLTSWRDAFDAPVEWEMYGSNSSGCVAISRESFLQVGGYDETWLDGYEDYDFAFRCAEMFGLNRRVEGDLIHLWHPRPAVEPENGRDRERFEKKWLAPR